ncbi:beta-galactosidase [Sanguibacter suaedae]|uniref:Beta-galactosidase n=1 Tax=Sanguibacter suaedae TaxID=2795737 RepID=A0A934M8D5_9MICO|nr:beta-galactosidase [Sanguibacter suaedae]MBI9113455.1 beta-galactosidase [Sanguibacter suaedae]
MSETPTHPSSRTAAPTGWLPGVEAVCYGGDYNPEQWPEDVWKEDVVLMREAGVNLVSVGIFSWARLEPEPGRFDLDWLDRLLDLLHSAGIRVDLGTPTAAPPAWFYAAHPDSRVVTRDGVTLGHGSRGMPSPSSPAYREACARITRALAERFGKHPALALWHVHNEYGAPVSDSYDEHSVRAFRRWLRARYGTLDALNTAWGTAFWGQSYGDWEHIGAPAASASVVNPAQRLDFARFTSDALLECFTAERDILHELAPGIPVTTNFMATSCPSMDLWRWAAEVDLVSNDHYLTAADPRNQVTLALDADLTRSLAGGKPWILMEHSTSGVNWQPRNVAKRRGEMARNALSHMGRGADAILFFQWRASRSGAEKFHSAMLPHAGASSRVFREVTELGATLGGLTEVMGSTVRPDVAILWDWESFWAQDLEWRPSEDVSHRERITAFYDQLWRDKIATDVVHPTADLSGYRLVLAPASYLLTDAAAQNLREYVSAGGTLAVSFFSGVVDEHDAVRPGGFLASLDDVLGVGVDEFLPLREGETVRLSGGALEGVTADVWADDLAVREATVVSTYASGTEGGPAAGQAAVTRNSFGDGAAWYVSTRLTGEGLTAFLDEVYVDAGLSPDRALPSDVETVRRTTPDGTTDYTFVLNHTDEAVTVPLPGVVVPTGAAPTGGEVQDSHVVPAGGSRVIRTVRR